MHLLDHNRLDRIGIAEAILCEGKSNKQINNICKELDDNTATLLTRLRPNVLLELNKNVKKKISYDSESNTGVYGKLPKLKRNTDVALISAGTSDLPFLLEAKWTLRCAGENCVILSDLGVAGLWRIQKHLKKILKYKIIIAAAGMDGALVSVLGGLIPMPLIALPTSTGYGVSNKGSTALNSMLASCSPGVVVVNIDNGYGAACAAIRILNGK